MRILMLTVALLSYANAAAAQDEAARGFVGGGAAIGSEAPGTRMRLGDDGGPEIWLIQGAVRIAPRTSIGIEIIQPGVSRGSTRGRTFQSFGKQKERAVLAVARLRVASRRRMSLDAVAGGGVLFQHHELEDAACFLGCTASRTDSMTNRATAFAIGADVPIRVASHFSIAPLGRVYFFRRGEHVTVVPGDAFLPWQFEWLPSRRLAIGVTARATW
jgi:hypothetical protein